MEMTDKYLVQVLRLLARHDQTWLAARGRLLKLRQLANGQFVFVDDDASLPRQRDLAHARADHIILRAVSGGSRLRAWNALVDAERKTP